MPPSPLPLLLLDVDGPLNPYYATASRRPPAYRRRLLPPPWPVAGGPETVEVWLDPGHGARLLALPYELEWASTWMAGANRWIGPAIGLPELAYVELPGPAESRPDGTSPKTWPIVRRAAGRAFAWVDDDITEADRAYVAEHHPGPALLHHVHPARGLTGDDFAVLAAWGLAVAA